MAKILLVEDDALLSEINSDVLKSAGHEVTLATDGEAALEKILFGKWDIILMDIMLPKMNGFDVIEQARGKENRQLPPVVFFTNMDMKEDKERAEKLSGSYVVKGNVSPENFLKLVSEKLSQPAS